MKKQIDVKNIKENPENPRYIKDERFDKLVKSIKDFPDMLEKRPLVLDENKMVLGGNMRLKAIKKAGIKKVWVDIAKGWSDDQKKEFIIKDNIGYGEWDWDILANEWDMDALDNWGLEVFMSEDDIEEMKNPENEDTDFAFSQELDDECNYVVLKFNKDIDWIQAKTLFGLKTVKSKRAIGKSWSKGVGRVLDGIEAIKKIQNES